MHTFNDPRTTDLHKIIKKTSCSVFEGKAAKDIFYPFHIKREFNKYLSCGVPLYGMVWHVFNVPYVKKINLLPILVRGELFVQDAMAEEWPIRQNI